MSKFDRQLYFEKMKLGQLELSDLKEYGKTKELYVPVLGDSSHVKHTKSIYFDYAASSPILGPVQEYANHLEDRFRSNIGRSYGFRERVIRTCYMSTKIAALKYFNASKGSLAVLGSNVTTLLNTLVKHINHKYSDGYFLLSSMGHSALCLPARKFSSRR